MVMAILSVSWSDVMAKIGTDQKHRFTWINPVSGEEYWESATRSQAVKSLRTVLVY